MSKLTNQSDHHNATANCAKIASPSSRETQLSPPRALVPFRVEARSGGMSPHRESENNEPQIHIRSTESGEICAWGLDQSGEEQIFSLTGNLDLINKCKDMSYDLCG